LESAEIKSSHSGGFRKFQKEWIEPILIALVLAAIIRTFIIQPFKIPSGSMEDTLLIGDQLMATKFVYGIKTPFSSKRYFKIRDPKPGDIIVFKYPIDPSKDFIKRCVAVQGQTIKIKDKHLFIDGKECPLPKHAKFIDPYIYPSDPAMPRDNMAERVIPKGMFFAMGDNRDNSNDSRFWGLVPYDNIKGKALIIYWSWDSNSPLAKKIRFGRILNLIK
jgi:signal peptidase I